MRPFSTVELLTLWEQGLSQTAIQRSIALVAAAYPDVSPEQAMRLSIGQRDRLLLTLREQLFGSQLVSVAVCPACGDRLELNFSVQEIQLPATEVPSIIEIHQGGYLVQVRLPNSLDLAAMMQWPAAALSDLRRRLLEQCLMGVQREQENRETIPVTDFPEDLVEAIATQLAAADPQADIQLDLGCPACGQKWQTAFDIGTFLWSEIHAWAVRLLREVHGLASAYGWSEADILAMSAQRRQWYLEMVGSA
ncbi:MAG: hypothetical protein WCD18_22935 [Thermosynechococcaceae cyanobacterium]